MAKNMTQDVTVNLLFTADTKQAKAQLEKLQESLSKLVTSSSGGIDKQMAAATRSAAELAAHLRKATNIETGTLDFTKLNLSIEKSGKSLAAYGENLISMGPAGLQAFLQLATAISNSEIPMRRVSLSLQKMGNVLKNTIRWLISSSAVHAFLSSIAGAYRYALDLNESLNNIRIVTGLSVEQMDKFAERANRAAKALSASTLDYTNAALIYYQLGLNDEEVQKRTDVTVKMANVTGDTAEKVSQLLTAVWNNFAKGGENLEYYADVMTALGAATASSSDEIAEGLSKFSAIADTVGLSYEYATAALATVTATTRQSADVVGNAFKTLFARMEGLKLGETLDDGTDLNKYSQALASVGVNIKTASGELKGMDNILEDLAATWSTLDKSQKSALAQTVGGVRQYNNLIALMDNWDFMQENLLVARGASGSLQELADIYAESWEAALKRVKAALEGVYQALVEDDFFIAILDGTEKAITGVNNLIKAFGGLPGVLSVIGVLVTNLFSKQLETGLSNMAYSISTMLPGGYEKQLAKRQDVINDFVERIPLSNDYTLEEERVKLDILREHLYTVEKLTLAKIELNDLEYQTANLLANQLDEELKKEQSLARLLDLAKELRSDLTHEVYKAFYLNNMELPNRLLRKDREELQELINVLEPLIKLEKEFDLLMNDTNLNFEQGSEEAQNYANSLKGIYDKLKNIKGVNLDELKKVEDIFKRLLNGSIGEQGGLALEAKMAVLIKGAMARAEGTIDANTGDGMGASLIESIRSVIQALEELNLSTLRVNQSRENFNLSLVHNLIMMKSWEETVVQCFSSISSLAMGINGLKGAFDVLSDSNMGFFDKMLSITTSLSFSLPLLARGLTSLQSGFLKLIPFLSGNILNMAYGGKLVSSLEPAIRNGKLNLNAIAQSYSALGTTIDGTLIKLKLLNAGFKDGDAITLLLMLSILGLSLSYKTLGTAILKVAGPIAAVTIALGTILYFHDLTWNKQKRLTEDANKGLENLKELLDEVNKSTLDLKTSWDKYDSVLNELKLLSKGTEEWNNKLLENNLLVLDLLQKYPLLSSYFKNINGVFLIDSAGYEVLAQDLLKKVLNILNEYLLLLTNASRLNNLYNRELLDRNLLSILTKLTNTSYGEVDRLISAINNNNYQNLEELLNNYVAINENLNKELYDNIKTVVNNYITAIQGINAANNNLDSSTWENLSSIGRNTAVNNINGFNQLDDQTQSLYSLFIGGLANNLNSVNVTKTLKNQYALDKDIEINKDNEAYKNITDSEVLAWYANRQLNNLFNDPNFISNMDELLKGLPETLIAALIGDMNTLSKNIDISMLFNDPEGLGLLENYKSKLLEIFSLKDSDWEVFKASIESKLKFIINDAGTVSIATIQKNIADLNKAFGSLKLGDTISADDFALLGEGALSYFTLMEDGTYKLIKSAELFNATLNLQKRQDLGNNIDNLLTYLANYNDHGIENGMEDKSDELLTNILNYLLISGTLAEYNMLLDELLAKGISLETLLSLESTILLDLASKYETCSDEMLKYSEVLNSNNERLIHATQVDLERSIAVAELANEFDLSVDDIEDLAKAYWDNNEILGKNLYSLKDIYSISTKMAVLNQTMNRGVSTLSKNWNSWNEILNKGDKSSLDYIDTIQGMKDSLKDLIGLTNKDLIPDDFFDKQENIDLMGKAAEGDADAVNALGTAFAKASIEQAKYVDGMPVNIVDPWSNAEENFNFYKNRVLDGITNLSLAINDGLILSGDGIEQYLGMSLDNFTSYLNEVAAATGMSTEQMQSMLNSLELEGTVEVTDVPIVHTLPRTHSWTRFVRPPDPETGAFETITETEELPGKPVVGTMQVALIAMGDKGVPPLKYVGRGKINPGSINSGGSSKGSSGGGGGSSKAKTTKVDSEKTRYKEITDDLEDVGHALKEAADEQDRLFGPKQWANMEHLITILKKLKALYEERANWTKKYLDEDRAALDKAFADLGYNGILDIDPETGNVNNFSQIQDWYHDKFNNAATAEEQEALEKLWEAFTKAESAYNEDLELQQQNVENAKEAARLIQDLFYDMMTNKIELRLELRKDDLQRIQNLINVLGDGLYKSAEVYSLMMSKWSQEPGVFDSTVARDLTLDFQNFKEAFDAGNISQSLYVEGLRTTMENVQLAIDDILSWSKEMEEYYLNTLQKLIDGLAGITDRIDHLNERLEHFKNIRSLAGMDLDYDVLDKILNGQLKAAKALTDIAYLLRDLMKRELDAMLDLYDTFLKTNPELAQKFLEEQLRPLLEEFEEADNSLHEAQEHQLEVATAVRDNLLDQAKLEAELALTMGKGFDALNDSMDMSSKYQDEYLTKTNQIYETNKLLRDINNDIDKTDNQLAKNKLKNFADEIEGMKEQNQLSQLDLKIAQARYELLQALIALEEAQNAKSIVRLLRDNEGNYGYVYTADLDKVGDAEQDLANKTNDLYNLVLENSNNYAQKMVELRQSTLELLAELDNNAADYEIRKKEIMDNAAKLYQSYADQYGTAMYWLGETAATDTFEAWTTQFIEPATYSVDSFTNTMNDYMGLTDQAVSQFKDNISDVTGIEEALDDVELNVEDVESAIDKLQNEAEDYIDTSSGVIEAVRDLTLEYYNMYEQIMLTLEALQLLNAELGAEKAALAGFTSSGDYSLDYIRAKNLGRDTSKILSDRANYISSTGNTSVLSNDEILAVEAAAKAKGMSGWEIEEEVRKSGWKGLKKKIAFASGGYTGSWGSEGKLALLHEKELVLNADDTKNFLQGVLILRQITSAIDLRAAVSSNASSSILPSFGGGAQTLEQQVTITAEFPNATNHTEIEEAFNNLINRASQYANRYR